MPEIVKISWRSVAITATLAVVSWLGWTARGIHAQVQRHEEMLSAVPVLEQCVRDMKDSVDRIDRTVSEINKHLLSQ